ncbi:MAG TPA: thiamine pyrophosphate-dependent enzyme [Nitrospirota bacterium]
MEAEVKKGAKQVTGFLSGNEMASIAASQINFHVMGYYPITPSTEIAENLDEMRAEGEHNILMIPGEGEHGAAAICYGASTTGARVFNATSAQGLLYAMEQMPVQSGTRYPMLLDLVMRSVSGPLDIRGDHSDVMMALNCGWIILMAKDPQAAYDLNFIGVKIGEIEDVRLPVIVAYDGFFTSHQKRRVQYFEDKQVIQDFVGSHPPRYISIDPRNPVTIGPYMNDPDLINNKKQQSMAMEAAYNHLDEVFEEYYRISGRRYGLIDTYMMDDAEVALVILNSAYETSKEAVDRLRAEGLKVGVMMPTAIRPFPAREIRKCMKKVKAICVADRQESFGGWGGNMSIEIKAALKDDPDNKTLVISRIYGLGGKEFYIEDAVDLIREAVDVAAKGKVSIPFEYAGATPGDLSFIPGQVQKPLTRDEMTPGILKVTRDDSTGAFDIKGVSARPLNEMPKRISQGHSACSGCGIFPGLDTFFKGIQGDVVVLYQTGCAMVVTTGYPYSSHNITYIHNLFQSGAPTLAGVVEGFKERQRRGEIPASEDITFVMITGDGGMDIGMGHAIGTALRNHKMIILEYDNQGYMNTGAQLSFSTPMGHATSTSHVGPYQTGNQLQHKDTVQIMAACNIPYVFTGIATQYRDLIKKATKAQYYAKNEGLVYGKILIACPLEWKSEEILGLEIIQAASDCCFFPLYEIEHGITNISYNPEEKGKKVHVTEWLKYMGKSKHLVKPEYKEVVETLQKEVDRRWERLKAMAAHPLL